MKIYTNSEMRRYENVCRKKRHKFNSKLHFNSERAWIMFQIDHLTVSNQFITHVCKCKRRKKNHKLYYYKQPKSSLWSKGQDLFGEHRASLIAAFFMLFLLLCLTQNRIEIYENLFSEHTSSLMCCCLYTYGFCVSNNVFLLHTFQGINISRSSKIEFYDRLVTLKSNSMGISYGITAVSGLLIWDISFIPNKFWFVECHILICMYRVS